MLQKGKGHLLIIYITTYLTILAGRAQGGDCPKAETIKPCECYAKTADYPFDTVFCHGDNPVDLAGLFANVSRELKGRDTNYHQFYLSNKNVVEIPAAVFGDLQFNVITVENAVNLQRIHSQAFRGTEGTVETFSVINSPVASSVANTADLFAAINSLNFLQYVNIYNTSLRNIPENAFNSLQHLHRIRIEYEIVEEISGNSFRNLPALKTLSLARNNLTHISDHAFNLDKNLGQILRISLNNNSLYDPSLTSGALSGLNVATIIDAEGNGFKHLDESVFGQFLRHPNNTQNDVIISTLDCTDCRNAWLTRGGSPAGRLFSAECQYLDFYDKNIFSKCP